MAVISSNKCKVLSAYGMCWFCLMMLAPLSLAHADILQLERDFKALYEEELGELKPCENKSRGEIKACSNALRNDGNAPYILVAPADKSADYATIVMFHGLSDSPYYLRSIAQHLHKSGHTVIVPLLPGHGKKRADKDMQDPRLATRWRKHVEDVMMLAHATSNNVFLAGFSAGGTLATDYLLNQAQGDKAQELRGLILFSGALQLSSGAESMASIWGMKKLAIWLDGDFESHGPNPYRYPKVASYSGLLLMDVIKDIRTVLQDEKRAASLDTPIYAAHSLADALTPYEGIQGLMQSINASHTEFKIDTEFDVCHRDVVLSSVQMINFDFDKTLVNQSERCAVPKANPQHNVMLFTLEYFIKEHSLVRM